MQALAALKSKLALKAFVKRDGQWIEIPAADLVPGDVVRLALGGIVPADARLLDGSVLLDQSMLTGESVAVEIGCWKHRLCRCARAAGRGHGGDHRDR